MARKSEIDPASVVFFAPEQLTADRVTAAIESGASGQEVADIHATPSRGEYREYQGEEIVQGVKQGKFGRRLQWVHPADSDDGSFRVYDGKDDDYQPVVTEEDK